MKFSRSIKLNSKN